MPAGNVVISGAFSQTPVESVKLEILSVSVDSTITPNLEYNTDTYTAKIPHIFPTVTDQKFSIIAIPEDPDATVSISSGVEDAGGEITLNEGKSEYTITVTRDGLGTNTYTFTVDYEPDLSLKSITLSSGEDANGDWTQTVTVQDGQVITIPYDSVTITAVPNDEGVMLAASKTGGDGAFSTDEPGKWTLAYTYGQGTSTLNSTVKIKSTKSAISWDEKDFTLQFEKIVDANWPTSFWAESTDPSNGKSIIKDGGKYYEVRTFIKSDTLSFPDDSVTTEYLKTAKFDYLIVAGGGGAGGANWSTGGGGGGAGGVLYKTGQSLTLESGSVSVTVGAGGKGSINAGTDGGDGGQSAIGSITVPGGGGGGGSWDAGKANAGISGGSGGGGGVGYGSGASGGATTAIDGVMGHAGAAANTTINMAGSGGGGGAGGVGTSVIGSNGTGGGAPWIPGGISAWVKGAAGSEISRGGNGGIKYTSLKPASGLNYGDGGSGNGGAGGAGGNGYGGGAGHSGIVVIRFPAKPNPPADD
jgi:hypothetical protein